jgi:hypothetical protein
MVVGAIVLGAFGMAAAAVAAAASLDGFARCLARRRATFYGTVWCPHCDAQRALFGRSFRWVRYVECSIDGTQALRPECAGVSGFPTWTFRDGSQVAGRMTLEGLSRKTGCSLDEPARDEPLVIDVPGTGAVPTASDSGVQIIEIP